MSENEFRILPFDPASAPEELWTAYLDHAEAMRHEIDAQDPLLPREKQRAMLQVAAGMPHVTKRFYLVLASGGGPAGYACASVESPASPSYAANKHICNLNLSVAQAYRRQGLGSRLLKHVMAELAAKEPSVTEFMSAVILAPGKAFCESLGGRVALEQAENRLDLKDVDWPLVERWAAEGRAKNPSSSVVTTRLIPEEDIADYSRAYTETMNQQPFGELTMKVVFTPEQIRQGEKECLETGEEDTIIYTREADGTVSGLTETTYLKDSPHKIRQMLTGVRERYRGRGLGKMLKALMLLHIRARRPGVKYVVTGNADSNAPMMAINEALGFKRHLPVHIYKLEVKKISEYL